MSRPPVSRAAAAAAPAALAAWLAAGLAAQAPAGGVALVPGDPLASFRVASGRGAAQIVAVNGPGFDRAIRVETRQPGRSWDVELSARVARAVDRSDVGLIAFWARASAARVETGEAYFSVYAQKASPDWDKSVYASLAVGPSWQRFAFPFRWTASYGPDQAMVAFAVGSHEQAVEIGAIEVVGYGPDYPIDELPTTAFTYAGREADAPWRAAAAARIDGIRKGDLVVEVEDADGDEIEEADVHVELRRHAFPFGSALQAARLTREGPDNDAYRVRAEALFNAATLENDLKWPAWEGDWGTGFSQPQALAALEWLTARRIGVRGHVLVWPGWSNLPRSITVLRGTPGAAERIPPLVLAHIDDITRRTAPFVDEWDVVNEPYANHDLMDLCGQGVLVDWFAAARRSLPSARLYLNDYGILSAHGADADHQAHFESTARFLLESGAPLDGLGMQGHFGASPTAIVTVQRVLDRFASLGLAIRVTEFDVDTKDEQLQADYTRDFLTMVFSHPAVAGFQMWGFWEGAHWTPDAAMYRRDWSEKPNGAAFRTLVHETWTTRLDGKTDDDGRLEARAFYGTYEISVAWRGRSARVQAEHRRGAGPTFIKVRL